jgi:hypothetical protein
MKSSMVILIFLPLFLKDVALLTNPSNFDPQKFSILDATQITMFITRNHSLKKKLSLINMFMLIGKEIQLD